MSKTNKQIEAEIKKLWESPWFPGQGSAIRRLEEQYNIKKIKK